MENEGNHGAHGKKFSFVEITEWRRGGWGQKFGYFEYTAVTFYCTECQKFAIKCAYLKYV